MTGLLAASVSLSTSCQDGSIPKTGAEFCLSGHDNFPAAWAWAFHLPAKSDLKLEMARPL